MRKSAVFILLLLVVGQSAFGMEWQLKETFDKKFSEIFARKKAERSFEYYTDKVLACPDHGINTALCSQICTIVHDCLGGGGLGLSYEEACKKVEEEYEKLVDEYKEYEQKYPRIVEENRTKGLIRVLGGLDYSMTLNEIKQCIKSKFFKMKQEGLIISRVQFEKIKDKFFLKTGICSKRDLTRIWGIEHIKFMIEGDEELHNAIGVQSHVIVVEDPTKPISVWVDVYSSRRNSYQMGPIVTKLENADIYFEYVKGKDVTKKIFREKGKKYKLLRRLHFSDFGRDSLAGLGNILEKDEKLYIVDTEQKSFFGFSAYSKQTPQSFSYYLQEKFAYDNNLESSVERIQVKID